MGIFGDEDVKQILKMIEPEVFTEEEEEEEEEEEGEEEDVSGEEEVRGWAGLGDHVLEPPLLALLHLNQSH